MSVTPAWELSLFSNTLKQEIESGVGRRDAAWERLSGLIAAAVVVQLVSAWLLPSDRGRCALLEGLASSFVV